jgi:hypothetical protein
MSLGQHRLRQAAGSRNKHHDRELRCVSAT